MVVFDQLVKPNDVQKQFKKSIGDGHVPNIKETLMKIESLRAKLDYT